MRKLETHKLEIFKLHKEGKTVREIANHINCSEAGVYSFLERHNRNVDGTTKLEVKNIFVPKKERRSIVNKRFIIEYLKNHPCVDCGNSDIRILEFDHIKGIKSGNVTQMARNGCDTSKLLQEIDKCEIRCCNCHRIATIERRIKPKE